MSWGLYVHNWKGAGSANQSPFNNFALQFQPDIYSRFDDPIGSTIVEDLGARRYTNSVVGTPTFEETGLLSDGGTSVRWETP